MGAAIAGALIGLAIVWGSGRDGTGAPAAEVTALTATPSISDACAERDALARATPVPVTPAAGATVVERAGVRIMLPPGFALAPNIIEPRSDPIWFFSSGLDAIDPAGGVRISLGVYPSAASYLVAQATPAPAATATAPPRIASPATAGEASPSAAAATQTATASATPAGTPAASIGDTFLFDVFRGSLPADTGDRCDHGTGSFAGPQRNVTFTYSDGAGSQLQLHQRAMFLLASGRVAIVAIDGLPAVVPWPDERAMFSSVLRSVSLGN
jgi:hypothetical protein